MEYVVIGIDPDSEKHGIAIYRKNALCELLSLNSIELYVHLTQHEKTALSESRLVIHMENPLGNSSSAFSHSKSEPLSVKFKKSESVGRVKQAQRSVEQLAELLGIPVVHHRNSNAWKKGTQAELFKRITGWSGRSNEDTRSAAYFGWLGCKSTNRK